MFKKKGLGFSNSDYVSKTSEEAKKESSYFKSETSNDGLEFLSYKSGKKFGHKNKLDYVSSSNKDSYVPKTKKFDYVSNTTSNGKKFDYVSSASSKKIFDYVSNISSKKFDYVSTTSSKKFDYVSNSSSKKSDFVSNPITKKYDKKFDYVSTVSNKKFDYESSVSGKKFDYVSNTSSKKYEKKLDYVSSLTGSGERKDNHANGVAKKSYKNNESYSQVDYDVDYDREVNELLDDIEVTFLSTNPKKLIKCEKIYSSCESLESFKEDNVKDAMANEYEDLSETTTDEEEDIPEWYERMLQKKIKEGRSRLNDLSNALCFSCASTRDFLIRMENDHNSPFCKLEDTRFRSLNKPWINKWKFSCVVKCKEELNPSPSPLHAHTDECQIIVLEHQHNFITLKIDNLNPTEYPQFLLDFLEAFELFINTDNYDPLLEDGELNDLTAEKPSWNWVQVRCNCDNELMVTVSGKNILSLIDKLKDFFKKGPGKHIKIGSFFYINNIWTTKKVSAPPIFLFGASELYDRVVNIKVRYTPKSVNWLNACEAETLGKTICKYLRPAPNDTVMELGCQVGVFSNMLAHKCLNVIGITSLDYEVKQANEISQINHITNSVFIYCKVSEVQVRANELLRKNNVVAILKLDSPFGKSFEVMRALRNIPSLSKVVIYGSFKRELHKQIATFVHKDEKLGEQFLPVNGCIVDRSTKSHDDFDIVILFERKSRIGKTIEKDLSVPPRIPKASVKSNAPVEKKKSVERQEPPKVCVKVEKDVDESSNSSSNSHKVKNPVYHASYNMAPVKKEPMDYEDQCSYKSGSCSRDGHVSINEVCVKKEKPFIKQEPMDITASPISDGGDIFIEDDIENAVTPKHEPANYSKSSKSPELRYDDKSAMKDHGFKVKQSESFMKYEKRSYRSRRRRSSTPELIEIDSSPRRDSREEEVLFNDLRHLLEKKKQLQKELDISGRRHSRSGRRDHRSRVYYESRRRESLESRDSREYRRRSNTPSLSPPRRRRHRASRSSSLSPRRHRRRYWSRSPSLSPPPYRPRNRSRTPTMSPQYSKRRNRVSETPSLSPPPSKRRNRTSRTPTVSPTPSSRRYRKSMTPTLSPRRRNRSRTPTLAPLPIKKEPRTSRTPTLSPPPVQRKITSPLTIKTRDSRTPSLSPPPSYVNQKIKSSPKSETYSDDMWDIPGISTIASVVVKSEKEPEKETQQEKPDDKRSISSSPSR